MLKNLNISNAAVAKSLDIDITRGFSVITGETGSGKSVLIDCLGMVCGSKLSRDIVRSGETRASVSALFDISEGDMSIFDALGIERDENGELLITRSITDDGRSTVKANGRSITLSALRGVSERLIGINTQDEKAFLSDKGEYVAVLDDYADTPELLEAYRESYSRLRTVENELEALKREASEKGMMVDILTYQIKEIDAARLNLDDEYEKLERLRTRIKSAERSEKCRRIVRRALSTNEKGYSAAYLLERASSALEQVADIVEGAPDMLRRLEEYRYDIIDIADTVDRALDIGLDGDVTEKLDQVETRLAHLDRLKKKYGASIAEIKAFREEAAAKLRRYSDFDTASAELEEKLTRLAGETATCADKLRESRRRAARTLSEEIISTLRYLDMPKVKFFIEVLPDLRDGKPVFTAKGADSIDFKISVNPGEPAASLSKVASGGELSRVMLALRSSLNKKSASETVVFDEIDAGVSGSTSEKIGRLLKRLSSSAQVLCVTHSPQIAALADVHYLIGKTEVDGRAQSYIKCLSDAERVDELSRIIGGINVTDKQRAAAREMIAEGKRANE